LVESQQLLEELRLACEQDASDDIRRVIHTLSGASRSVGATRVVAVAQQSNSWTEADRERHIGPWLENLQHAVEQAVTAIRSYLSPSR